MGSAAPAPATPRVLLLLPNASYRNEAFLAAARRLGIEAVAAADYCHRLAPAWGLPARLAVPFDQPREAADILLAEIAPPVAAVLAVDDAGTELAALVSERLGLPSNPPQAVRTVRDKLAFRTLLRAREFQCPGFHHLPSGADPGHLGRELRYPVVVKARRLSGSRGVVRADNPRQLRQAVDWVRRIQARADRDAAALGILIEDFIPGTEHALEGILEHGALRVLALFDKPDPLDGPHFEETIYVTPSRLAPPLQDEMAAAVQRACRLAGLVTGPVHAEARVNAAGVWLLEVAPRSIGGLCGRVLTHALGMELEELVLRHALGEPVPAPAHSEAAGVMMIPIPRRGIYQGVHNLEAALRVPGITGIRMVAEPGQLIAPPPEGASYLGFIFSRGGTPQQAEIALRIAQRQLAFDIAPGYPAREVSA